MTAFTHSRGVVPSNDNARRLAAWCAGGDVVCTGGPITMALAHQQLGWHARVAMTTSDRWTAQQSALIAMDYHAAIQGAETWRSAAKVRVPA